jgi:hypothetical protein
LQDAAKEKWLARANVPPWQRDGRFYLPQLFD